MTKKLILCFFILVNTILHAQVFSGPGGGIPDNGTPISFPLTISGLTPASLDSTFGLEAVEININHTYDSDLDIWLIAPDSTWIELSTGNGGSGQNYTNTFFYDTAATPIAGSVAPFTGSFLPEGKLYAADNGQNPNGVWQLYVHDTYAFADSGTVINWNLVFGNHPGKPVSFSSSNLPIIKINTNGQQIIDDPKILCNMKIIDNGAGNRNYLTDTVYTYNGYIGIEIRGSSSQSFPKKSFSVETEDSTGANLDVSLMGMPIENDWILNANYTDKSLLRNTISYDLFNKMGHYASRTQYCELMVNGIYQGVYIFMEKIKRDSNRVNISKLTTADTSGTGLTGGYILKIDKFTGSGGPGWTTLYNPPSGGAKPFVQYEYPKSTDILPQQEVYIQSYVDSFENALAGNSFKDTAIGYPHYIEETSWIDYFILNEFSKNVDGFRLSTYFYKKKDTKGSKLTMGPAWDYDIAWGNANYYNGNLASGWDYTFPYNTDPFQVPFWWDRLLQDPAFANAMRCRWNALRNGPLATATLTMWVDSMGSYLNESQQRNFQMWPILGVYVWPNPNPIPTTYTGELLKLKSWLISRSLWLDANIPGNCTISGIENTYSDTPVLSVYPNPAEDILSVDFKTSDTPALNNSGRRTVSLTLTDIVGRKIMEQQLTTVDGSNLYKLNISKYPSGIYLLNVKTAKENFEVKVVKK